MLTHQLRIGATAAALVLAMILAEWLGRRQRVGAVILGLISLAWLTVDVAWEGPILVSFDKRHGLTLADLLGLAGIVRSLWVLVRRTSRRR